MGWGEEEETLHTKRTLVKKRTWGQDIPGGRSQSRPPGELSSYQGYQRRLFFILTKKSELSKV